MIRLGVSTAALGPGPAHPTHPIPPVKDPDAPAPSPQPDPDPDPTHPSSPPINEPTPMKPAEFDAFIKAETDADEAESAEVGITF